MYLTGANRLKIVLMKFLIFDLFLFLCRDTRVAAQIGVSKSPEPEVSRDSSDVFVPRDTCSGTEICETMLDVVVMKILNSPLLPSSQKHLSS